MVLVCATLVAALVASAQVTCVAAEEGTINELIAALKSPDWPTRYRAAKELGDRGAKAAPAVRALRDALRDKEASVRFTAAESLGKVGPRAKEAVPDLIDALKDPEESVREDAALALGKIGAAARKAVPALQTAQVDASHAVRRAAGAAIEEIQAPPRPPPAATPAPAPARLAPMASVAVRDTDDQDTGPPLLVEKYLYSGKLAEGERALTEELKKNTKDDRMRFGLGTLQFVRAVEHLGQSLYRYGVRSDRGQRMQIPFLRLPVPINPNPAEFSYAEARKIFENLLDELHKAEGTLAAVRDEQVKLPLRLGRVRLDFVNDGNSTERLMSLLTHYFPGAAMLPADARFLVVFDRGDVAWLRGYCHLLMALAEIGLAYDSQELFDCCGHLFFSKVKTPHKFLHDARGHSGLFDLGDGVDIVDVITMIHLIRFPVHEPARLKKALNHFQQVLALSKESWKFILAETDDDHEWIPNPRQKGALGIPVRQEMVDSWLKLINEAEALLAGTRLVPFWRGDEERGVNLRRVFTEPRPLDLVLWVQGAAATPYLEKGTFTQQAVWERLQRVFRGEFIGFAIWFN
jgi:hypothetical protein